MILMFCFLEAKFASSVVFLVNSRREKHKDILGRLPRSKPNMGISYSRNPIRFLIIFKHEFSHIFGNSDSQASYS
jgi:hypothetical protein